MSGGTRLFDTFLHLCDIYGNHDPRHEDALKKMVGEARDFDDWRNVFYRACPGTPLRDKALARMIRLAKTFGQWLSVYCEDDDNDAKLRFLGEMMALAEDPKDAVFPVSRPACLKLPRWQKIFEISPIGSEEEKLAEAAIFALMREKKEKEAKRMEELKKQGIFSSPLI